MKKILVVLFGALMIFQSGLTCCAAESGGFFATLKNAIIKDVQDTVTNTATAAANRVLNTVKLNQYKQELAQKKQDLADLEASKTNFIVKFFKRRKLNNEISELEAKIKELEK